MRTALAVAAFALIFSADSAQAFECTFKTIAQKHACLIRLSTLQVRLSVQADLVYVEKRLDEKKNEIEVRTKRTIAFNSKGSGFVVDGKRNLLVTAKHVFLSNRAWDIDLQHSGYSNSADIHSAIEGFLRKYGTFELRVSGSEGPIQARLLALDPYSDLALLQYGGPDPLIDSRISDPFLPVAFGRNCERSVSIMGSGYPETNRDIFAQTPWGQIENCLVMPQLYDEGRPWTSALLHSTNASFDSGMSGGPVINEQGKLVGAIAGAAVNGKRSFLVPVAAIRRFLGRQGFDIDYE